MMSDSMYNTYRGQRQEETDVLPLLQKYLLLFYRYGVDKSFAAFQNLFN